MKTHTDPSISARIEESPSNTKPAGPSSRSAKPSAPPSSVSPEQIQKTKKILYALLGFLVVADFFIYREHAALMWESIP